MADKIFIGDGKNREYDGFSYQKVTVDIDSLIREYANHGFVTEKGKRKIVLEIGKKKNMDQFGKDLYVAVDCWHPDNYVPPWPIDIGGQLSDDQINEKNESLKADNQNDSDSGGGFTGYTPKSKSKPFDGYNGPEKFDDDVPF